MVHVNVGGHRVFASRLQTSLRRGQRSLRLRGPDGDLVPLVVRRVYGYADVSPAVSIDQGTYTVEARIAYDDAGQQLPLGSRGARVAGVRRDAWFPVERLDLPAVEPPAPPSDPWIRRDENGIRVHAIVPAGARLGLEVDGVGLVALGRVRDDAPDRQHAWVNDIPCDGFRLPMRSPVVVRLVCHYPDGTTIPGDAYEVLPPKRRPWRIFEGRFRALPDPRPLPHSDDSKAPAPDAPDPCGTWAILERQSVDLGARVRSRRHLVLEDDGPHAVFQTDRGWLHYGPDGTRTPLGRAPNGSVDRLEDRRFWWSDDEGIWSASVDDPSEATLEHIRVRGMPSGVTVRGRRVDGLDGRDVHSHVLRDEDSVWFVTHIDSTTGKGPRRYDFQLVQVRDDGSELLSDAPLEAGYRWDISPSGELVRSPIDGDRDAIEAFRLEDGERIPVPYEAPVRHRRVPIERIPGNTQIQLEPTDDGFEIQTWGCTEDGLGAPETWLQ